MLENAEHQQKLMSLLSKFVNKNYINKFKKNINNKFSNNINENALFMIFKLSSIILNLWEYSSPNLLAWDNFS